MIVKHIPKVSLDYDPYEEDCCGSHPGEAVEIDCGHGIVFRVQQKDSGIGSSWEVTVTNSWNRLYAFMDDDGQLVSGMDSGI